MYRVAMLAKLWNNYEQKTVLIPCFSAASLRRFDDCFYLVGSLK